MIIYFSGTGNSRYAAEGLADLTGDWCVEARKLMHAHAAVSLYSQTPWVFVCPTYAWRPPRIFSDFIERCGYAGSREAYFVMTCGDDIGAADRIYESFCKRANMHYRGTWPLKMPENYIAIYKAPDASACVGIMDAADASLARLAEQIAQGQALPDVRHHLTDLLKSRIINPLFYRFIVQAKPFSCGDACNSCGKCARVCPLDNIAMRDGKPVWGNKCTHCMACISSCPQTAIEYGKHTLGKRRYRCLDWMARHGKEENQLGK